MAAFNHFSMHTQLNMTVNRTKFGNRVGIAQSSLRIHFGSRTTCGTLDHPQHRPANLQFATDPVPFGQGRRTGEPHIGAKPAPVPAGADL